MLFQQKTVFVLILLAFLSRIMFVAFFLPNDASAFAPDESTYSSLAIYVANGNPVQEFPIFGPDLYNSSRTFILPAALLIDLGVGELLAVRLISLSYGALSIVFLGLCYVSYLKNFRKDNLGDVYLNQEFLSSS